MYLSYVCSACAKFVLILLQLYNENVSEWRVPSTILMSCSIVMNAIVWHATHIQVMPKMSLQGARNVHDVHGL